MKIVIHVLVAALAVVATVISAHDYYGGGYRGGYGDDMGGAIGGYMGGPYSRGMMGSMAGMGGAYGGRHGLWGRRRGFLHCKCRELCYAGEFRWGTCWWCNNWTCSTRCCRWIYMY